MSSSHADDRPSQDDRCAECGRAVGDEWVSYRRDTANPENLVRHFGGIVLAGPAEPPREKPKPTIRDFCYPEDLGVFFHPWCAPQAKLPEATQKEIGRLLAEIIIASYERTIARWSTVVQALSREDQPPRFHAQVASIQARRVFAMLRTEWQRLRAHEGKLVELEVERLPGGAVAAAAAVIARLASECSVQTERIEVWRYNEQVRPRPEALQDYLVLENLTRRIKLPMFVERTSTRDTPALRKHLGNHVFLVRDEEDKGRWQPKARTVERLAFLLT
jgi:hypothetical protein